MNLKKFDACPNHCILYRGKYENLESCSHYGVSRYKRNANFQVDANNEEASSGPKKKKTAKKSSAKQILSHKNEEEEGYTQRKSPALSMCYLPVNDRLCAIFRNPEVGAPRKDALTRAKLLN